MKLFHVVFAASSALLLVGGCVMKSPSPRAAVEVTPPEKLHVEERDFAESKRAYYVLLRERTVAIRHDRNLSSYAEAEKIAAQELGPPPTTGTRVESFSTEDLRAAEQAKKRQKYNEDLKSAAEEVSGQRSP